MGRPALKALPHSDLLQRVFDLSAGGFTKPLADAILQLDFPPADAERAALLNEKANDGELTPVEADELEAFVNVADLLALWQVKARAFLEHQ